MPNLQTVAQLLSLILILTAGPAIIVLITLKQGKL